jgi:hypothetical protein
MANSSKTYKIENVIHSCQRLAISSVRNNQPRIYTRTYARPRTTQDKPLPIPRYTMHGRCITNNHYIAIWTSHSLAWPPFLYLMCRHVLRSILIEIRTHHIWMLASFCNNLRQFAWHPNHHSFLICKTGVQKCRRNRTRRGVVILAQLRRQTNRTTIYAQQLHGYLGGGGPPPVASPNVCYIM